MRAELRDFLVASFQSENERNLNRRDSLSFPRVLPDFYVSPSITASAGPTRGHGAAIDADMTLRAAISCATKSFTVELRLTQFREGSARHA